MANKIGFIAVVAAVILAVAFAITPATSWTSGTTGNYNPTAAGGFAAMGGNVTDINLAANVSTSKWAGMYGNVSGTIKLAKSTSVIFYTWTWSPTSGAEICASTNSTFNAITATATSGAVDTAWGFASSDADTATKTMTVNCTLDNVTGTDITGSDAVSTSEVDAGTQTCVAKQDSGTAKDSYVFCAPIIATGFTFDGLLRNYALMVPTAQSGTETYYFYLELE